MKKLLIAMLVGLLLIGAASAGGPNHHDKDKKGIATSCANALAAGTAYVDKCVVAGSSDALTIKTQSYTGTWQIDDAKVDPISASLSVGFATSAIDGDIKVGGRHSSDVEADMSATSLATAFNFARGSDIATGTTNTFNIANNCITEDKLTSTSIAGSSSTGFAMGTPDPRCNGEIDDIYQVEDNVPDL
jgi:hypothetical protein